MVAGAQRVFALRPMLAVGLFAGSLTNTPALAAALEQVKAAADSDARQLTDPVVGYSIAYPMGVIGMMAAIATL